MAIKPIPGRTPTEMAAINRCLDEILAARDLCDARYAEARQHNPPGLRDDRVLGSEADRIMTAAELDYKAACEAVFRRREAAVGF